MTDIVLRMKTLPDLTNEKAWEVVYEGANEIERLRKLLAIANDGLKDIAGRAFSRLAQSDPPN